MQTKRFFLTIGVILFPFIIGISQAEKQKMFYNIDIQDEINSSSWRHVQKGFEEAKKVSPNAIIIHMNTYGGEVLYADSIRTKILNSTIPVYVFIDNNAASAGALISIACEKIFMRKGGNIGAATVVNQNGEQMPDKYQSYMRGLIRSTAESHGKRMLINGKDTTYEWKRDPLIAEAMVDDRIAIPGIIDSGKVLTFTTDEAIKHNYCEGTAENIDELIRTQLNCSHYILKSYKPTTMDNIMGFLTSTAVRGILIMLIIAGIYFEFQVPGFGFPSVIAITAAVLYFAPLYLDGLAANWEILLFVVGLILLALEIFVIPGFGITGILGILSIFCGLVLSLIGNNAFNFDSVEGSDVLHAVIMVLSSLIFSALLMLYISSKIGSKGIFKKVALGANQMKEEGYIAVPTINKTLVGKTGTVYSDLRPSGKVSIDNNVVDAISEEGYIEKGKLVIVNKYESGQVYVSKKE